MFKALSKITIRGSKLIVLAWLLIVVLSFNSMQKLNSKLSYDWAKFMPTNLESNTASQLLAEKFGAHSGSDVVVLIIETSEVTSQKFLNFLIDLKSRIESSPNLPELEGVTTIYDVWIDANKTYWEIMGLQRRYIYEIMLDNVTTLYCALMALKNATMGATYLIYGVPKLYVYVWINTTATHPQYMFNVYESNNKSYDISRDIIINELSDEPEDVKNITLNWLYTFYLGWNESFPGKVILPTELLPENAFKRAQNVIDNRYSEHSAPYFINETFKDNETMRQFMIDVWISFNITNFDDDALLREFVVNKTVEYAPPEWKSLIREMAEDLYDLGENATQEDLERVAEYYTDKVMEAIIAMYPPPQTFPEGIPPDVYRMYVSSDNKTTLVVITLEDVSTNRVSPVINEINRIVEETILLHPEVYVTVSMTGSILFSKDVREQSREDIHRIDTITVIMVLGILLISFASVVAPIVPLIAVIMVIIVAQGVLYFLTTIGIEILYLVRILMTPVAMGAGVDYCILFISRFFEERRKGIPHIEAVRITTESAGKAVISSGLTASLGFAALIPSQLGVIRIVGIGEVIVLLLCILVAITFIPSMLAIAGDKIFWPRDISKEIGAPSHLTFRKCGFTAIKHKGKVIIIITVVLTALMLPFLTTKVSFDDIELMPDHLESKKAFNIMAETFGRQRIDKTYILIINNNTNMYDNLETIYLITANIEKIDGVSKVYSAVAPLGEVIDYENLTLADYIMIAPFISSDNTTTLIYVEMKFNPASNEAIATLDKIRGLIEDLKKVDPMLSKSQIYFGGTTQFIYELKQIMDRDFKIMALTVILGIMIVLSLHLKSLFTPPRLIFTILLSIFGTLGMITIIFYYLMGKPIYWLTPYVLFVVLMGLGMDYDIFLISRTKEEIDKGLSDEAAIIESVEMTGPIITTCGIILAFSFGSLMISPLLFIMEIGLAFLISILLDIFVIRLFLVPAIMATAKRWNWWPGKRGVSE